MLPTRWLPHRGCSGVRHFFKSTERSGNKCWRIVPASTPDICSSGPPYEEQTSATLLRLHYQALHICEVFSIHLNAGCDVILLLFGLCFLWEIFLEEGSQVLVNARWKQISASSGNEDRQPPIATANRSLLTGICSHDNISSTQRAMFRFGILHLDHASYAENVVTL